MKIDTQENKKETYIKCKKCGTEIFSITCGDLIPCKCGSISVDGQTLTFNTIVI